MDPESILKATKARFGIGESESSSIEAIAKGGSDRSFFRVVSGERSYLVMRYSTSRAENGFYYGIAIFLRELGVAVPEIYGHDPKTRLLWMQDLGSKDLWSVRGELWAKLRIHYRDALEEVLRLHSRGRAALAGSSTPLNTPFDARLYRWEQEYFLERCAGGVFGISEQERAEVFDCPALVGMAAELAAMPRVPIHRDFQSQNLLLHANRVYLIDFQGMRYGLPHYDLASLLYDPYVELRDAQRAELAEGYREMASAAGLPLPDYGYVFLQCAAQRLMQALGAYGFLSRVRGKTEFAVHIGPALGRLRSVVVRLPGFDRLLRLLDKLQGSLV